MLGHVMLAVLSESPNLEVIGTVRSSASIKRLSPALRSLCNVTLDVDSQDQLTNLFATQQPDVIVNCVGLIKQLEQANNPLAVLPVNSILPHRLAELCKISGARLIHISTDCVFSGSKGNYLEEDLSDATDLYGKSKYIGEVFYPNTVTLRTSIIGHELNGNNALVEWFLSQNIPILGFTKAVFSGLPTVELSRVVRDYVLINKALSGVYHVASSPINKYELLSQIAHIYNKKIIISREDNFVINRSLNGSKFSQDTGYVPPSWPELILLMHNFFYTSGYYV